MALRKNEHNYPAARRLRRSLSLPEAILWRLLRGNPQGIKIRRQHPVGRYVIDFYCARTRTGFEIDGIAHTMDGRPQADDQRDAWLAAQGITVVRIPASDVLADPVGAAEAIIGLCRKAGE